MGKQAFDKKLEAIEALRSSPDGLSKALKDRNNFLVSKAAAIAGQQGLKAFIPALTAAFDRFMTNPVKTDPKCWAKTSIVKALKDLEHDDATLFIRGLKHIQMEPAFLRPEDTAVPMRGTCAMALVACPLPRVEILTCLIDALGADPEKAVRIDAARAIAQIPGPDSVLLLRLKALNGDKDPDVTGQCFSSLLEILPSEQLRFVAGFLSAGDAEVRLEAATALGACHEPEAAGLLIENYQTNPDEEMKRAILFSLGASRQTAAADFLLSVIDDDRQEHAAIAIQSLAAGRFRDEYRACVQTAVAARDHPKLQAAFEKEFTS